MPPSITRRSMVVELTLFNSLGSRAFPCLSVCLSVCLAKGFIAAQLDLAEEKKRRRGNLVNKTRTKTGRRGRAGAAGAERAWGLSRHPIPTRPSARVRVRREGRSELRDTEMIFNTRERLRYLAVAVTAARYIPEIHRRLRHGSDGKMSPYFSPSPEPRTCSCSAGTRICRDRLLDWPTEREQNWRS